MKKSIAKQTTLRTCSVIYLGFFTCSQSSGDHPWKHVEKVAIIQRKINFAKKKKKGLLRSQCPILLVFCWMWCFWTSTMSILKKKITNIMFFWRLHDANIKDKIKTSQNTLKMRNHTNKNWYYCCSDAKETALIKWILLLNI